MDGINIALLPDLSPVSINNVNCGNPFAGAGPNCEYFNNNDTGAHDIEYDGFNDAFTASVTGLFPGSHRYPGCHARPACLETGTLNEQTSSRNRRFPVRMS